MKENKLNKMIDTVILDIGNVLVEFVPREYLQNIGIEKNQIEEILNAVVENDIWNEYDRGVMSYDETLKKFIERTPKLEKEIRKAFHNLNGIVKMFDYTENFIRELKKKGYRVLYLSNISEKLFHDCESELQFVKEMDGGILSFEAKMIKPEKDIYELIIKKYNLVPENCVFLDDRSINISAAKKAGLKTILFTSYEEAKERILQI